MKITFKKDPNADSRTAKANTTKVELALATQEHIRGVRTIMDLMLEKLADGAEKHDFTKIRYLDDFYKDFTSAAKEGTKFTESDWYQLHINTERHHLFSRVPDDVNLFDVLEMIADCIHAGLTRSGDYKPLELNPELLVKAVKNTEDWVLERVEVEG